MKTELVISLDLKSTPVTLTKGEVKKPYSICEMTGTLRDQYLADTKSRTRMNGDKMEMDSYEGLYADLLCRCLRDKDGKLLTKQEVQEFPSSAQQTLFKEAQKLNGLFGEEKEQGQEEAEEQAKNE